MGTVLIQGGHYHYCRGSTTELENLSELFWARTRNHCRRWQTVASFYSESPVSHYYCSFASAGCWLSSSTSLAKQSLLMSNLFLLLSLCHWFVSPSALSTPLCLPRYSQSFRVCTSLDFGRIRQRRKCCGRRQHAINERGSSACRFVRNCWKQRALSIHKMLVRVMNEIFWEGICRTIGDNRKRE